MKYPLTNAICKTGINYIRNIIESKNCIFNEIHQENDVGIDAIVELVKEESPTGNCLALQIKSGLSYFDSNKNRCLIPIKGHFKYWKNYALPVFGIVYVPTHEKAYWIDIKKYINEHEIQIIDGRISTIKFEISKLNQFDIDDFEKIFIPYVMRELPELSFDEAIVLFHSKNYEERYVGLITLFKKYADKKSVWDEFVSYFKNSNTENIPNRLIYILSYIPWHGDLWWDKESITAESKKHAKTLIHNFNRKDIIKLLYFIDEENFISRGSIGQCVEAIISIIPFFDNILEEIILDEKQPPNIKESAAAIYAYHKGRDSLLILKKVSEIDAWYIPQIIEYIEEYGFFNPYN